MTAASCVLPFVTVTPMWSYYSHVSLWHEQIVIWQSGTFMANYLQHSFTFGYVEVDTLDFLPQARFKCLADTANDVQEEKH